MTLFKKATALFIALMMLITLFAGCGNEQKDPAIPTVSESDSAESETQAIPELTKELAAEILKCYTKTASFGLYVEYQKSYVPENIPDRFSEYYDFLKVTNFHTFQEGKELTTKYLSSEIAGRCWEQGKDAFFFDNGNVIIAVIAHGLQSYELDSIKIEQQSETMTLVYADRYDETEEYQSTDSFVVQYADGAWRMTSAPEYSHIKNPKPQKNNGYMQ